jgi:hypothetical protein
MFSVAGDRSIKPRTRINLNHIHNFNKKKQLKMGFFLKRYLYKAYLFRIFYPKLTTKLIFFKNSFFFSYETEATCFSKIYIHSTAKTIAIIISKRGLLGASSIIPALQTLTSPRMRCGHFPSVFGSRRLPTTTTQTHTPVCVVKQSLNIGQI